MHLIAFYLGAKLRHEICGSIGIWDMLYCNLGHQMRFIRFNSGTKLASMKSVGQIGYMIGANVKAKFTLTFKFELGQIRS